MTQLLNLFDTSRFFGNRNRTLVLLLLNTGLRGGEVSNLTLADYDSRDRLLIVRDTKNGTDGVVPLTPAMVESLDDYLNNWRSNIPGPWLFPRSTGTRLAAQRIRGIFSECAHALGWRVHAHMCRTTFATVMLQNGASLEAVRRILRHKSLASTSVYLQTDMAYLQQQHDLFSPTNGLNL